MGRPACRAQHQREVPTRGLRSFLGAACLTSRTPGTPTAVLCPSTSHHPPHRPPRLPPAALKPLLVLREEGRVMRLLLDRPFLGTDGGAAAQPPPRPLHKAPTPGRHLLLFAPRCCPLTHLVKPTPRGPCLRHLDPGCMPGSCVSSSAQVRGGRRGAAGRHSGAGSGDPAVSLVGGPVQTPLDRRGPRLTSLCTRRPALQALVGRPLARPHPSWRPTPGRFARL